MQAGNKYADEVEENYVLCYVGANLINWATIKWCDITQKNCGTMWMQRDMVIYSRCFLQPFQCSSCIFEYLR